MDKPKLDEIKDGRGVLVEVLRVGACGTDREINNGEYGVAPKGFDFLVLGHENFGRVVEIGRKRQRITRKAILSSPRFAVRAVRAFTTKSASRILRPTTNITSAEFPEFTAIWRNFTSKAQIF